MRAQVSFFVIAGLLLLLTVAFFLYAASKTGDVVSLQTDSTHQYMESCIKAQAEQGIKRLGMYSGRTEGTTSDYILTIQESELLFNEWMSQKSIECISNYPNQEGLLIEPGTPIVDTTLSSNILIRIDDAYSYSTANRHVASEPFEITLPVRYSLVRDAAVEQQASNDYIEDRGALQEQGFDIGAAEYQGKQLWLIADAYSTVDNGPFYFAFLK